MDLLRDLHLGLALKKTQLYDIVFPLAEPLHCIRQRERLDPAGFFIFLVGDLIHDIERVAAVGVDRVVEADRALDRIVHRRSPPW